MDLVTGGGVEAPAAVEVADRVYRLIGHSYECEMGLKMAEGLL